MIRLLLCVLSIVACIGCGGDRAPADAPQTPAAPPPPTATAKQGAAPEPTADRGSGLLARAEIVPRLRGTDVANEYTRQFYGGQLKELFGKFSDEMKTVLPLQQLTERRSQFASQFGPETQVVREESKMDGDYRAFVRWARFERYDGVIGVQWILREDDSIAGFFIRPAQPSTPKP